MVTGGFVSGDCTEQIRTDSASAVCACVLSFRELMLSVLFSVFCSSVLCRFGGDLIPGLTRCVGRALWYGFSLAHFSSYNLLCFVCGVWCCFCFFCSTNETVGASTDPNKANGQAVVR